MKIGLVLDDSLDKLDGVQQAVLTIGEWMRLKGHDVHYLVGRTERKDIKNIHSLAKTIRVKFNGNTMGTPLPLSGRRLKNFYTSNSFDVLHVQMPYSPFFAAKAILLAPKKTKIIGTFHILPYTKLSAWATKQLARLTRKSLKRFDTFISVSEPAAEFAKASFGISSVVIPNPIFADKFLDARKPSKRIGCKRIVFLGRLEERKGVLELLKAYKHLIESNPLFLKNTKLTIAGKGRLSDTVHKIIATFPEGAQTEELGYIKESEKAELLASADVAVFPSTSGESFGIVLVEAMAAGSKVIIAGNNPGYASVLRERPELLFDPKNTAEFTNKLSWALDDATCSDELTDWYSSQAKLYDVENVGGQILELYES